MHAPVMYMQVAPKDLAGIIRIRLMMIPGVNPELGMAETDIPKIVDQVIANPYANPVEVTQEGLTRLLRAAWAGEPPDAEPA